MFCKQNRAKLCVALAELGAQITLFIQSMDSSESNYLYLLALDAVPRDCPRYTLFC